MPKPSLQKNSSSSTIQSIAGLDKGIYIFPMGISEIELSYPTKFSNFLSTIAQSSMLATIPTPTYKNDDRRLLSDVLDQSPARSACDITSLSAHNTNSESCTS